MSYYRRSSKLSCYDLVMLIICCILMLDNYKESVLASPKMKAVYIAYSGKRSPAPIVLSQTGQKTRRDCARICARANYCMGYNAITVSPTSMTCNILAVKLVDDGLTLVTDATSVYYELN